MHKRRIKHFGTKTTRFSTRTLVLTELKDYFFFFKEKGFVLKLQEIYIQVAIIWIITYYMCYYTHILCLTYSPKLVSITSPSSSCNSSITCSQFENTPEQTES